MTRLTIPDVLERFAGYNAKHPSWGCLHSILDDGNVEDNCTQPSPNDTEEAAELRVLLSRMSRTQRLKLPRKVDEVLKQRQVAAEKAKAPARLPLIRSVEVSGLGATAHYSAGHFTAEYKPDPPLKGRIERGEYWAEFTASITDSTDSTVSLSGTIHDHNCPSVEEAGALVESGLRQAGDSE